MADGKAGAAGAGSGAGAAAQPGAAAGAVPDKFTVKKADGTVDYEASAKKLAESYTQLEQRLGKGAAPPATPDDYKPELPEGFDAEVLAADPLYKSFLKGAHAKGLTNEQVSYILTEFAQRQSIATPTPEKAVEALRQVWQSEAEFNTNARHAFKAISDIDGLSEADRQAIDSNPLALRILAHFGKQLAEDVAPILPGTPAAQSWDEQMAAIRAHPGFMDASHPEHAQLMAKQEALYQRKHGKKPQGGLVSAQK